MHRRQTPYDNVQGRNTDLLDRKFYILKVDGEKNGRPHGTRNFYVDENPHHYDFFQYANENDDSFLRPEVIPKWDWRNWNDEAGEHCNTPEAKIFLKWTAGPKGVSRHYSNGKWKEEVLRLEETRLKDLKKMEEQRYVPENNIKPGPSQFSREPLKISKQAASSNSGEDAPQLMDMPKEVLENIIRFLDAFSFVSWTETNAEAAKLLWGALGNNEEKQYQFWKASAFEKIPRQRLCKILSSFDSVLELPNRLIDNRRLPNEDFELPYDSTEHYSWKDVCRADIDLLRTLTLGKVNVHNMDVLERKIKTQIRLCENESFITKPIQWGYPTVAVQTYGNVCLYLLSPWVRYNVRIMEGLDECKERRIVRLCNHSQNRNFLYLTMIHNPEPFFKDENDVPKIGLPKVHRTLISTCHSCTYIRPLMYGTGEFIQHVKDQVDYEWDVDPLPMDPIIAINGPAFSVWQGPSFIRFYKFQPKTGDNGLSVTLLTGMHIRKGFQYWNLIAQNLNYYIPQLKLKKNPQDFNDPKLRAVFNNNDAMLRQDYYEFRMVSMRFGVDIISIRNPYRWVVPSATLTQDLPPRRAEFKIMHQHPQYYYKNALKYRDDLIECNWGAEAYGTFIFWNDLAIAISKTGLTWFFTSWAMALRNIEGVAFSQEELKVSHVCICREDLICAAISGQLAIFKMKALGAEELDPRLELEPIRLIMLNMSLFYLEVLNLSFDYDFGKPYIFLMMKRNDTQSAYHFFMKRFTFDPPHPKEDKKREIVSRKNTWRRNGFAASKKAENGPDVTARDDNELKYFLRIPALEDLKKLVVAHAPPGSFNIHSKVNRGIVKMMHDTNRGNKNRRDRLEREEKERLKKEKADKEKEKKNEEGRRLTDEINRTFEAKRLAQLIEDYQEISKTDIHPPGILALIKQKREAEEREKQAHSGPSPECGIGSPTAKPSTSQAVEVAGPSSTGQEEMSGADVFRYTHQLNPTWKL